MGDALLSEGLLQAALPLLRPDAGNGPMHALMRAIQALPDCVGGVDAQAGWASLAASCSAQQATHLSDVYTYSMAVCDIQRYILIHCLLSSCISSTQMQAPVPCKCDQYRMLYKCGSGSVQM